MSSEDWEDILSLENQNDWPLVRKLMWIAKMPTPCFKDKKREDEFYREKYGIEGGENSE